ncbi:MAG: DNA repair protein RecO [Saprospiraceae bacterium]|nr:DNA repair protein RecO [Saprospiraceae bacterium]
MNLYTSKGIIFRSLKYSETSIICDIYTREKGLRSFIVSGVRTSKSGSKAAIYHHLNIVEIVSYNQEAEKLSRINEIRLVHHYRKINVQVIVSSVAIFILEICRNAIKERESNSELYDFLESWLIFLDEEVQLHPCIHLLFMIELSNEIGFGPMNNLSEINTCFDMTEGLFTPGSTAAYVMDKEESLAFLSLINVDKYAIQQITIHKLLRDSLTDHLITYFRLHMSGFKNINSLEVLRSIL